MCSHKWINVDVGLNAKKKVFVIDKPCDTKIISAGRYYNLVQLGGLQAFCVTDCGEKKSLLFTFALE